MTDPILALEAMEPESPPREVVLGALRLFRYRVIATVAVQAVVNLISDWNAEPVLHTAADDIDEDEIERLRRAVGVEGVGDLDVTRGAIQGNQVEPK